MDIPQILDCVDEAVCAKTGEHLNDLQRRIIAGILQRQTYAEVAQNNRYSEKHVKKASHQLLQMLSNVFGEHVKNKNLASVLERQINQNITLGNQNSQNIIGINCIKNCPYTSPTTPDKSQPATSVGQQDSNNNININIETIDKLREFGLIDEQIAEALGLPLEAVQQI